MDRINIHSHEANEKEVFWWPEGGSEETSERAAGHRVQIPAEHLHRNTCMRQGGDPFRRLRERRRAMGLPPNEGVLTCMDGGRYKVTVYLLGDLHDSVECCA